MPEYECRLCGREVPTVEPPTETSPICSTCNSRPVKTSSLAIASFVFGLAGCIPPMGLIALILGIVAYQEIGGSRSWLAGRGWALAGIALGLLGCLAMFAPYPIVPLASARRSARSWENGTQLRGIHQGEIFFAQSNNGWYTGFDRNGKLDTGHVFNGDPQSTDWNGYDQSTPRSPAWRLRRLLENAYFAGDYCITPNDKFPRWQSGEPMDPSKFSYGMLRIEGEADSPRKREHRQTNSALAPLISDRAISNGSGYMSIHVSPPPLDAVKWVGGICWGDNHVSFEHDAFVHTRYGKVVNRDDNLFTESNPSGQPNAEAAMPWKGAGDTAAELME